MNMSSPSGSGGSSGATMMMMTQPEPVYYNGMTLDDAMQYNPHPAALVSLLRTHDHLYKEFHYHDPILSAQIRDPSLTMEQASDVYRREMVKVGETKRFNFSSTALAATTPLMVIFIVTSTGWN
jgi:hypothetical protein